MITFLILLSVLCIVQFIILIVVLRSAIKVVRERDALYTFFEDTLDDVGSVMAMLDKLMQRQMLADDPDVQALYRVIAVTHDILLDYSNAHKQKGKGK